MQALVSTLKWYIITYTMARRDLPDIRQIPLGHGMTVTYNLLNAIVHNYGTPTKSFNFLHLGIQEYFATKYVTTLPENEVYTLL